MLVQGLAFEKLVTTKTLTNKLIMHQDRAVGKSPAVLCRCFRDVAEKPKTAEMLTLPSTIWKTKPGEGGVSASVLGLCHWLTVQGKRHHMVTLNLKEQKRLMVLNEIERRQITGKQAIEYSTVTQPEKISRFQA